jgi:hypothetical protein
MPAKKLPAANDALGAPALGAGAGMVFTKLIIENVHDESLKNILIALSPAITRA